MSAACVRVIHGANDGTFDLEGATVDRVRRSLVDAFNVPEDAIAFVNGEQVDPANYRLACQDTLEFCRQAGVKGAGKKNFTEEDLKKLGFAIVGDQAVPIEDAYPDESWASTRLEAYAKGRLANSSQAEALSILQAEKAAVDLYWAGCALRIIRNQKKAAGRGVWTEWLRSNNLAPSTVHEAIVLYENAKTPDALAELGITRAKEKFVYPFKVNGEGEPGTPADSVPEKRPAKTRGEVANKPRKKPTVIQADAPDEPEEDDDGEFAADESPVIEPTRTLTTELEEIAQRLNEIAQDDMGKVDWKEVDQDRFFNAGQAVQDAMHNIFVRINNELFPN